VICEDGRRWFLPVPGVRHPLKEAQLDLSLRIREMDAAGVSRQVLSLAVILGTFLAALPDELEEDIVSANNRGLSRLIKAQSDRFSGLAVLPLRHPERASEVLEEAVVGQGLLGAILPADAFLDKLKAGRLVPVFETADRIGAHLFIHPGPLPGAAAQPVSADEADLIRRRAVAFQNSLTAALITFEYTDFLDPYPRARVHVANLGGTIALLAERIVMTADRMGLPSELSSGRLRRVFVDTASFGARGVTLAAQVLGAERMVFGTDSPALSLAPGRAGVLDADLDDGTRWAILKGDAFSRAGSHS
jgi:predicted TIM-barrel fold metal-dependent hydrolase